MYQLHKLRRNELQVKGMSACTDVRAYGGAEVEPHSFLTSALEEVRFTPATAKSFRTGKVSVRSESLYNRNLAGILRNSERLRQQSHYTDKLWY